MTTDPETTGIGARHRFAFRRSCLEVAAVIGLILTIGLTTVGDYGVASDERTEMQSVFWNVERITTGRPLPNFQAYYGNVFHLAAEAFYQAVSFFRTGDGLPDRFDGAAPNQGENRASFRRRIAVKHVFTLLFSIFGYLAVAVSVGILAGARYAWLGPAFLALTPRFWGNSFFNPKDLPFAVMFTVGSVAGAWMIGRYLHATAGAVQVRTNRPRAMSVLFGVLLGLVTGTRIAGCFLLAFVPAVHLAVHLREGGSVRQFSRSWGFYGLVFAGWAVTTTLVHPASWSNPPLWFVESLRFMSRFEWEGSNLFNGHYVDANDVPLSYIPMWIAITTPVFILFLFMAGLAGLLVRVRRLTGLQLACALLLMLQMGFLVSAAVVRDSTIYDGVRQFLFILPAMAAVAASALAWFLQAARSRMLRTAAVILILLLAVPVIVDMVRLHPYEYLYFNRISGGLAGAYGRFDTDYYGLSMREAMEWVNRDGGPNARVVSTRPLPSSETFALSGIDVIPLPEFDPLLTPKPFYYVALPRYDLQQKFPDCRTAYEVTRQEVPLAIVKKCG